MRYNEGNKNGKGALSMKLTFLGATHEVTGRFL